MRRHDSIIDSIPKAIDSATTCSFDSKCDVTNDASVENGVKSVLAQAERLDVLINNAGIGSLNVSEAFTTDHRELYDVKVFGVQRVLRSVLPSFRSQGQGLVINIGSTVGRLMASINRFVTTPPASHSQYSHSFFGKLTSQQWAALIYKHLDHHLRQFGRVVKLPHKTT